MKAAIFSGSLVFLLALPLADLTCQTTEGKALSLSYSIPLPGVKGRIDHMAFDAGRQYIYVAALGNNTVEVIDLKNKKLVHSIQGMAEPQGIRYISERNAIFIANGNNGECDVLDADSFKKIASVKPGSDADNVRYDPGKSKIYVGYGDGGIAIIDAKSFRQLASIKLPGHPESFQLDNEDGKLFVNVPESKILATIDLSTNTVTNTMKITIASENFPMALDLKNHRIFIGCRNPAKLIVINSESGNIITRIDIDNDTDDIFYDAQSKQVYVSCGSGFVDVIKQLDPDKYEITSRIESRAGARTSLFVPELNQLIVAAPARSGTDAQLLVYEKRIQP